MNTEYRIKIRYTKPRSFSINVLISDVSETIISLEQNYYFWNRISIKLNIEIQFRKKRTIKRIIHRMLKLFEFHSLKKVKRI